MHVQRGGDRASPKSELVVLDLPGFGDSPPPPREEASIEALAPA